ncbi:MAG TPA: translocation/assembly module TamB domain-containing protein, partial [Bryobacteraceae bacterium]|nr:translocation/assembly module TamB domain-containing protein [Bryobacteraceae bacterium]
TLTGLFVSGPKRVNLSARFEHAGTQFPAGVLDFNLTSNTMPLNQIALIRARQPDIHGFGKFHADGAIRIAHDAKHEIMFSLLNMNADASANTLELGGRNLGDARFIAQTKDGVMRATFDSNAAKAVIHGDGTMGLEGDYPVNAKIVFTKAGLNALAALAVTEDQAKDLNFDGEVEGEAIITGQALKPDGLSAAIAISHLEVRPLPGSALAQTLPGFVLTNAAPLLATATLSQIRIENAHFKAPQTDLTLAGSIAMNAQTPLNLRVQGSVNLALAQTLNKDFASSGELILNSTLRGDWKNPDLNGRATIRNAAFRYADFSNGLTNANGDIAFSGTRATIQSFHGESGGGKVDVTGFAALTGGLLNFRLEAKSQQVRLRYPEGVSSISDSSLTLAGTSLRSEASGSITIRRVSVNPKSDAVNILASTVEPIRTPPVKTGFLSNMHLDIRIQTASDVALQTSVAQSIDADASLTLRGTVTNPALLGRINITQGELNFFGNKYSINQGTISFIDPVRIDPILNIDFETKARGVDVIFTVSGAIGKLNFTYRSDPPLQFSDIVALLATGRTPTDPTLAVRDTGQAQSFQQLGASALLGQALANPVAGRLQRFFGVSRLKIDPQLTGITGSPEARLTVEQQITPEILFTYITDVSSTSTQLIRVEWSFNRHWSAILIREENGYVGLDFAYKKRFK